MRNYELMYILPGQLAEAELQPMRQRVLDLLQQKQATVKEERIFSQQRLAYPIKQQHQGWYILAEFQSTPEIVKELNRELLLMSDILRHQIIVNPVQARPKEARPTGRPPAAKQKAPKIDEEALEKKLEEITAGQII